jgi:hypothetical protein
LSVLLFLNELSCGTSQSPEQVNETMEEFVGLLRHLRKRRGDVSLVTMVKREDLELAQGYYVSQWINAKPRNRDLWRVVQGIRNRSPIADVFPHDDALGSEYTWNGLEAKGLQAAHRTDGLLVSILTDSVWDTSWVDAMCMELSEETDGSFDSYAVRQRHAAKPSHMGPHDDWTGQVGLTALRTGAEIWEARADLYPNLEFLPRVEGQLRDLIPEWVLPVANRLRTLQDAVGKWDPQKDAEPPWVNVTPDSEGRKKLCWFVDGDAKELFDLHARFTPGVGRVHLRLIRAEGKVRIAHIGRKLGLANS